MKITKTYTYKQSVDEIAAAYLDKGFLEAKFEAIGSRKIDVSIAAHDGDEFEVNISREVATEVPRALKSFINPWNKAGQIEKWTGSDGGPYSATIEFLTEGVPVTVSAVVKLSKKGAGCEYIATTNIECSIPLVGKKLAQFVAKVSAEALDDEYAFISEHA